MVDISRMPDRERLILASLSGRADRYGIGHARDADDAEAIAAIREVTTDPRLLGIQLGLRRVDPHERHARTRRLLEMAGANQAVADEQEAELRARLEHRGGGPRDSGSPTGLR